MHCRDQYYQNRGINPRNLVMPIGPDCSTLYYTCVFTCYLHYSSLLVMKCQTYPTEIHQCVYIYICVVYILLPLAPIEATVLLNICYILR